MSGIFKWMLPFAAAMTLVIGFSALTAQAQDAKGKGTVTGTVLDKDGKAVEGITVNLYKPFTRPAAQAAMPNEAVPLQAQKGQRPEPVATATTGKDGKFTMKDVPAGEYSVSVRDQAKSLYGRAQVTVEDGKTATVEIKCTDTPPARGGGKKAQ